MDECEIMFSLTSYVANIGPSSETTDQVYDFIDDFAAWILVVIEDLLGEIWGALVTVFVTLSPIIGVLLIMSIFLYMFNEKFVSGR